jgi:hypothetical protein
MTRPHRTVAGAAALVALLAPPAFAEWTTIRDENGVTVQEQDARDRVLPILLGVTTIEAPPRDVLSWIQDVSTHTGWMHNCEEARLLGNDGDGVVYSYSRMGSPWPVSDRDVVLRVETTPSSDGAVRVEFRSTDEVEVAEVSSVVRMPRLEGHYDLRPLESGGTRVEYRLDTDPGGSLPGWLVKRASRDLPYFTLLNLRSRVEAALP